MSPGPILLMNITLKLAYSQYIVKNFLIWVLPIILLSNIFGNMQLSQLYYQTDQDSFWHEILGW